MSDTATLSRAQRRAQRAANKPADETPNPRAQIGDNEAAFDVKAETAKFFALGVEYGAGTKQRDEGEGRRTNAHAQSLTLFAKLCEADAVPNAGAVVGWFCKWRYGVNTTETAPLFPDRALASHFAAVYDACAKQKALGVTFSDTIAQATAMIDKMAAARKEPGAKKSELPEPRSQALGIYQLANASRGPELTKKKGGPRGPAVVLDTSAIAKAVTAGGDKATPATTADGKPAESKNGNPIKASVSAIIESLNGILDKVDENAELADEWSNQLIDLVSTLRKFRGAL